MLIRGSFLETAYYGAKGHLNAAVEQAAGLVALSGLRESLCEDLELSEETEVGVALEEGAALGLTHGCEWSDCNICREVQS